MPCAAAFERNIGADMVDQYTGGETMMMASRQWLSQQLDSVDDGTPGVLLLDCRAPNDYNASHVVGAIHVAIPPLLLRRLKKGNLAVTTVISGNEGRDQFTRRCQEETLVVYDDSSSESNVNPTGIAWLLLKKLRGDGHRARLLNGGFTAFHQECPQQCVGVDTGTNDGVDELATSPCIFGLRQLRISDDGDDVTSLKGDVIGGAAAATTTAFPVEVMPYLFLGNAKNARDLECLYRNGIRYVLNVTPNIPNTFETHDDFRYLQIPIHDHWSQNLSAHFTEAIAFIDEAREKKSGVLVHCLAGISRSVTVTVAYIMHKLALSLNDAFDYVKRCKSNIAPNFNFMGQLLDFENTLRDAKRCACVGRDFASCPGCTCGGGGTKTYFSSPASSTSSCKSASSSTSSASTTSSSAEFSYDDVAPSPS